MPHDQDKIIKQDDKGNFDDLKFEAVDPSITDNNQFIKKIDGTDSNVPNPRFGKHRFLDWALKHHEETNEEYWEATGSDGIIYRIESDEPPKPKKKGKVVIITNG